MSSKVQRLKIKFQSNMRRKVIYRWIGVIVALEVAFFAWSYYANFNPASLTQKIPGVFTPKAPAFITDIYGDLNTPLKKPMAVTVSNNHIYVSDTSNSRIQIFDYEGRPLSNFGSSGTGQGQFRFPYGIASDSLGQIYVADLYNSNISVFDRDGKFLRYLGVKGDFAKPAGLAIDGDKVYIADAEKNQVMVYSTAGQKLSSFGKAGNQPGFLQSPNAIAHANGKIFVTDTGNDRVEVFDEQGKLLNVFTGSPDPNNPALSNPRGIAVDSRGLVYVVSNMTNRIFAFNQKGETVFTFGSSGTEDNQFQLPNGLTIDNQGKIYITDTLGARILVFQS